MALDKHVSDSRVLSSLEYEVDGYMEILAHIKFDGFSEDAMSCLEESKRRILDDIEDLKLFPYRVGMLERETALHLHKILDDEDHKRLLLIQAWKKIQ